MRYLFPHSPQASSLKSRCQQDHTFPGALGADPSSLLASQVAPGVSGLVGTSSSLSPSSSYGPLRESE